MLFSIKRADMIIYSCNFSRRLPPLPLRLFAFDATLIYHDRVPSSHLPMDAMPTRATSAGLQHNVVVGTAC